jgi:hypothetical protein
VYVDYKQPNSLLYRVFLKKQKYGLLLHSKVQRFCPKLWMFAWLIFWRIKFFAIFFSFLHSCFWCFLDWNVESICYAKEGEKKSFCPIANSKIKFQPDLIIEPRLSTISLYSQIEFRKYFKNIFLNSPFVLSFKRKDHIYQENITWLYLLYFFAMISFGKSWKSWKQ